MCVLRPVELQENVVQRTAPGRKLTGGGGDGEQRVFLGYPLESDPRLALIHTTYFQIDLESGASLGDDVHKLEICPSQIVVVFAVVDVDHLDLEVLVGLEDKKVLKAGTPVWVEVVLGDLRFPHHPLAVPSHPIRLPQLKLRVAGPKHPVLVHQIYR